MDVKRSFLHKNELKIYDVQHHLQANANGGKCYPALRRNNKQESRNMKETPAKFRGSALHLPNNPG